MKKAFCTSLVLLLMISGISAAFAAETKDASAPAAAGTSTPAAIETTGAAIKATDAAIKTTGAAVIVPDMTFTGTPIKLSLEDAYKKMLADSPQVEAAKLNKQRAVGIANGFGEKVRLINK